MGETAETRLKAMGITLPHAAAPAANYLPFVKTGNLLFISGQLPMKDGKMIHSGIVGGDVSLDDATGCARLCAINILAQAKAATGDLEKLARLVKISIFVASTSDFTSQHIVGNGASNLLAEVLGDKGKHARAAVGMASLPLNAPVEIEAIFEVE